MVLLHKWKFDNEIKDYVGSANGSSDTSNDAPGIYSGRSRLFVKASSQRMSVNPADTGLTALTVMYLVNYSAVLADNIAYTAFGPSAWGVGKVLMRSWIRVGSVPRNSPTIDEYTQSTSSTYTNTNTALVAGKNTLQMFTALVSSKTTYGYVDGVQRVKVVGNISMSNMTLANYYFGSDFQNAYLGGRLDEMEIYNEVKTLAFMKTKEAYYKGVF